eukprot:TRINITY_DN5731_c0_g1_i1.p1 TRINITY_DN5731_c0_g1~~TRINITY_DN5731_c0_g1_i1.p1  ORF type:complete len:473 (-),score=60.16 TRINITY_DN5731_c0_g1_i1:642-2060(-)
MVRQHYCWKIVLLVLSQVEVSRQQIKYTKSDVASNIEVSGEVLGDLTSSLQFSAQTAFFEVNSNDASELESIVSGLAQDMANTIANVIQDLLLGGFTSPLEEAAQISGAVRIALQASLADGSSDVLSEFDIVTIVNQLVGNLEDILRSTPNDIQISQLVELVRAPLQDALFQGFRISSGIPPSPLFIRSPNIVSSNPSPPTQTPTPTPTPAPPPATTTNQGTYVFTQQGVRVLVGGCFDITPPGGFTCGEQKKLGKCGRGWMLQESFCAQTCGYCTDDDVCIDIQPTTDVPCNQLKSQGECNSQLLINNNFCKKTCNRCVGGGAPDVVVQAAAAAAEPVCFDVQPNTQYTCAEQKQFGKCQAQWMISGGFCSLTCQHCNTQIPHTQVKPVSSECMDIAPDDKFSCEQQKTFGKCESFWMVQGGFCRRSCSRCDGSLTQPQAAPSEPPQQQVSRQVAQLLADAIERVLRDLGV